MHQSIRAAKIVISTGTRKPVACAQFLDVLLNAKIGRMKDVHAGPALRHLRLRAQREPVKRGEVAFFSDARDDRVGQPLPARPTVAGYRRRRTTAPRF